MLSELPPEALDTKSRLASFEALWDGDALEGHGKIGLGRAGSSALFSPREHSDAFQSRPLVRTTTFDEVDDEEEESDEDNSSVARFTRRSSSAVLGDEAGALLEVQLEAVHCANEIRILEQQIAGFKAGTTAGRPPPNESAAANGTRPERPSVPGPTHVASIAERAQHLYAEAQRCEVALGQIELGIAPIDRLLLAEIKQIREDCAWLASAEDASVNATKVSIVQAPVSPDASRHTDTRAVREELAAWVVELAAWAQAMAGRYERHIGEGLEGEGTHRV